MEHEMETRTTERFIEIRRGWSGSPETSGIGQAMSLSSLIIYML